MNTDTVVVAQGLSRHYEVKSHLFSPPRITQALTEANFRLQAGKTLAVVGESGCGKSTLARLVTMIEEPTAGALKSTGSQPLQKAGDVCERVCRLSFKIPTVP